MTQPKCGPSHYAGCACTEARHEAEKERLRDELVAERDRLAADALAALSGARIPTPENGYVAEPHMLMLDILRLAKERDAAQAEAKRLRECLIDFRDHGVRHDLNPTGMFHECGHFEVWERQGGWHAYLRNADGWVRERARTALAHPDLASWLAREAARDEVIDAARGITHRSARLGRAFQRLYELERGEESHDDRT